MTRTLSGHQLPKSWHPPGRHWQDRCQYCDRQLSCCCIRHTVRMRWCSNACKCRARRAVARAMASMVP
jgi:hypothetical protein